MLRVWHLILIVLIVGLIALGIRAHNNKVTATVEAYRQFGAGFTFDFEAVIWCAPMVKGNAMTPSFFWRKKPNGELDAYAPSNDQRAPVLVTLEKGAGEYKYFNDVPPNKSRWAKLRPPRLDERKYWFENTPSGVMASNRWILEIHLHKDEYSGEPPPPPLASR